MKYIKTYEEIVSDKEIEDEFNNFTITEIKVEKIHDDGGASGYIEIYYTSEDRFVVDNWIKYRSQLNNNNPRYGFDHWFPEKVSNELEKVIEKEIKKEKLRRDAEKYNL